MSIEVDPNKSLSLIDNAQYIKNFSSSNIELMEAKIQSPDSADTPQNGQTENYIEAAKVYCAIGGRSQSALDTKGINSNKVRFDYWYFQWFFIIFFTLITVIDRFTINLWPLWVNSPGPTIPGNFSVSCFSLIAWISSRMLLVSSSYVFLFQCNVFWNWFVETKFANKYLIIGDIHQTNHRIHYHVGWAFVGIPVVLHVWVIIFAIAFPQNSVKLYPSWMRPNDPELGKSIPFYANDLISMGWNDVYRIITTSLTFFILIPWSIWTYTKTMNWSLAQYLHLCGAMIYTIDLIRMKSHPHCWVVNCPFILWWLCDRIYGIFWYRRCVAKLVCKQYLDNDYIIFYLNIPDKYHDLRSVGDVFYFNILDCGFDRAHPFTVFQNHQKSHKLIHRNSTELNPNWDGHKFTIRRNSDSNISEYKMYRKNSISHSHSQPQPIANNSNESRSNSQINTINKSNNWNLGIMMQVHAPHTDCLKRKTFTSGLLESECEYFSGLRCWGPYRSEYRKLTQQISIIPLILIGTGAGCSFLIDFYFYIRNNKINLTQPVYLYFTARSVALFQYFTDLTCSKKINGLYVNAHLTSHGNIKCNEPTKNAKIGRLSFEQVLEKSTPETNVYFCGAPQLQEIVVNKCKELNLKCHGGHSFA